MKNKAIKKLPSKVIKKMPSKDKIADLEERLEKSIKLSEEAIKLAQTATQPKVIPTPILIVEDLPEMTKEQLMLKLADIIMLAWTKVSFRGENSRQLNVFNSLNSILAQELLKEILSR